MNILKNLVMDDIDNKFIIMARIAVSARKKGFITTVSLFDTFAQITIQDQNDDFKIKKTESTTDNTEEELLNWWDAIEASI